jgi:glucokinase
MTATALVGDVGGTHARFALIDLATAVPVIREARDLLSHSYGHARDAVAAYLAETTLKTPPAIAVIAVAGPVIDGAVRFTNLGWSFADSDLHALGIGRARLINDFEALAWATERLTDADMHPLGIACKGDANATRAVIGPGTGFGTSALVRNGAAKLVMAAEGGHASFAPGDAVEREILAVLAERFGHVSIERIISGPGLRNLHDALNTIDGTSAPANDPAEISRRGLAGEAPFARTLARFSAILGSVAGDFALAYGARGGLYIAGGIAPLMLPALDTREFRRRFESKGRFEAYLKAIPTHVILHRQPAFLGAAALALQLVEHP